MCAAARPAAAEQRPPLTSPFTDQGVDLPQLGIGEFGHTASSEPGPQQPPADRGRGPGERLDGQLRWISDQQLGRDRVEGVVVLAVAAPPCGRGRRRRRRAARPRAAAAPRGAAGRGCRAGRRCAGPPIGQPRAAQARSVVGRRHAEQRAAPWRVQRPHAGDRAGARAAAEARAAPSPPGRRGCGRGARSCLAPAGPSAARRSGHSAPRPPCRPGLRPWSSGRSRGAGPARLVGPPPSPRPRRSRIGGRGRRSAHAR